VSFALVAHAEAGASGSNDTVTSSSIDTTGADILFVYVTDYQAASLGTVTDSRSNTWTALTAHAAASFSRGRWYYAKNATVGSGHTFTYSGTSVFPSICALAFSGSDTTAPADQENGATSASGTTLATGSVTPGQDNELVLAGFTFASTGTPITAPSGYTDVGGSDFGGNHFGSWVAYKIQTTATATNPSFTKSGGASDLAAVVATFKAAGGGAATSYTFTGPSSGTVNVASTNFTVTPNGTSTATVTPASDGAGSFTPSTVTFDGTNAAKTFTYTPTSTSGSPHTLSVTNSGSLTDPASIDYTVNPPSPPTSGVATFSSADATTINMVCTAASGGTGSKTYQWYRSTTSGFTPGGGNILSGATSLSLADTASLSVGPIYFYKLVTTDAAAQTATSNQAAGSLWGAALYLYGAGDSLTDGFGVTTKPITLVGAALQGALLRPVTVVNHGVGGSTSGAWLTGGTNHNAALAAFTTPGLVVLTLGTNDCSGGVSAATYGSNMADAAAGFVAAGHTVLLNDPPGFDPTPAVASHDEAALARLETYLSQLDSIANGGTILRLRTNAFAYFAAVVSELVADGVHFTDAGNERWASMIEKATIAAISPAATGGGFFSSDQNGGFNG
jgi:lysophospholipase L1-like esterase